MVPPNSTAALAAGAAQPVVAISSPQYAAPSFINGALTVMGFRSRITQTLTYYVFDIPTNSGNFGLQVFNPAGVLTFDSSRQYARVVDVFGGPTRAHWEGSRTYPAGRAYAVVQLNTATRREIENVGGKYSATYFSSMSQVSGNVVQTSMQRYLTKDVAAQATTEDSSASFAVIDVTGY